MSKARQLADLGNVYDDGALSNRNLIINGAMQVAQRGTSATGVTLNGYYACDRFQYNKSGRDEAIVTVSQASDAPDGFVKSFKIETTTAETAIEATEYFMARYKIEAQDLQHLKYGTSSAQQLTLSFWVKSSIAATYSVYLYSEDGSRIIGSTYTISNASTWEYKTITFAGDTGGTINDDTGSGLDLAFVLAAGSDMRDTDNTAWSSYAGEKLAYGHTAAANAVITTSGATWQITGVQLEVGDTATPFEHRSYGDELARCQRYFYRAADGIFKTLGLGVNYAPSYMAGVVYFPVTMRATPALDAASGTNYYEFIRNSASDAFNSLSLGNRTTNKIGEIFNNNEISGTVGHGGWIRTDNAAVYVDFNAEL